MATYKMIPIKSAIEEYLSLTDDKGRLDRAYMKKLANSISRKLTFEDQLRHKVVLLDVVDNMVELPDDFQSIVQVAFRDDTEKKVQRSQIVEWVQKTQEGCDLVISLDCPKCTTTQCSCDTQDIVFDIDRDFMMAHPEYVYGHMKHYYRHGGLTNTNIPISPYYPDFFLIKYARHTMFGADYHIKGCLNLDARLMSNSTVNYVVENGDYLRLNTKEGQILLSYFEYVTDEDGYRHIPDLEDIFDTIKWYIEEMITYRQYRKTKDSSYLRLSNRAKVIKEESMGRAREKLRTMDFQNYWSFLENNYVKVVGYDSWQQDFNRAQRDKFGDTLDRLTSHR